MTKQISHPNFFVVGSVKGGTTALHLFLDQHPEVYMSPVKETNFFSQDDMDSAHFNRDYKHDVRIDLDSYLAGPMTKKIHIANLEKWEHYSALFSKVNGEKAIGEASNSYLLSKSAASRIHERYPDAKIMMMLRNPIDRAFSQYLMNLRLGKTLEEDFIKEFEADSTKKYQGWGVSHNYKELGFFASQLGRFLQFFPRKNVKVLLYDDYRADPGGTMQDIFKFLGVSPSIDLNLNKRPNSASVPRFKRLNYFLFQSGAINFVKQFVPDGLKDTAKSMIFSKKGLPKIKEAEKAYLRNIYKAEIEELGKMLQRDLSHWLA